MTPGTWEYAVHQLDHATSPVTTEQLLVAEKAGVPLGARVPKLVAASQLRSALAKELILKPAVPVTAYDREYLKSLRKETKLPVDPANHDEALAWISYLRQLRRIKRLKDLKPVPGDIVSLGGGETCEVSSVGDDGRVHFRGGRGYRAWPDMIESTVAKAGDASKAAARARSAAENAAAERLSSPEWSAAKDEDLAEFAVEGQPDESEIDELEDVIDRAKDEKPIQTFLQERPQLLAALVGGQYRYCIPQKRLADRFIPDFVLGGVDSLGVEWVLVELETPRSGIYLKGGGAFDKFARKGVDQIDDWRDWLKNQIAIAQGPRKKGGLGLPNISNQSSGLVIVGRRSLRPKRITDAKRFALRDSHVHVHTYDWLLARLRGAVNFDGPYAYNPHLLRRSAEERYRDARER